MAAHLVAPPRRRGTYVHVERVDAQVIRGQLERLEHLLQRQVAVVAENHHVLMRITSDTVRRRADALPLAVLDSAASICRPPHLGASLELGLDEPQQVLLVHAGAVVHMRVDLADVVKVAVWHQLRRQARHNGRDLATIGKLVMGKWRWLLQG